MTSNVKVEKARDFKERPYNGDRSEWVDFKRYLKTEIQKHAKVPKKWKDYLFLDFPVIPPMINAPPSDIPIYDVPAQFVERIVMAPAANNASVEAQRIRNENIKRDEAYNEAIGASLSTITGIICDCISAGLNKVFADRFLLDPYAFYRNLAATYGPAAAVNEDRNQCLFNLLKYKMNNEETFDVFMIGFNQKCDYLDLKEHTRRVFLMTTLSATENKIQLLPDRLVDEFKSIRERDLD